MSALYAPALSALITHSLTQLWATMEAHAPAMTAQVKPWAHQLAGSAPPTAYFEHPSAFPSLLIPWWVEHTITAQPHSALQADLVYSTINGYYYIRLLDNVMDGHGTNEQKFLTAASFFHTQFQMTYQKYFDFQHPFWEAYQRIWLAAAEVTLLDASLPRIDLEQFRRLAALKISACKIPLTAVCHFYQRPDLIEPWAQFCDRYGAWHQMRNDLFDWNKDLQHQTPTYFLSTAQRRKHPTESVLAWVVREGFDAGISELLAWMDELQNLAQTLNCEAVERYLMVKQSLLAEQHTQVREDFKSVAKFLV